MRFRGARVLCAGAIVAACALAAPGAASAATSSYEVGAAKVDITPPPFDPAHDEPAFSTCPPGLDGARQFRFEEPYKDLNGNGRYDFGSPNPADMKPPEPFCDANQNQRYDGIFSSGDVDSLAKAVHDPIDVRAIAISAKGHTYVVASVVAQGIFENYIEEMRQAAMKRRPIDDMVVSANHNESSPDTVGIYGSPSIAQTGVNASARSGIDEYYMDWLVQRVADAGVAAYDAMKPGTLFARQVPLPDAVHVHLSNNFPTTYDSEDKPAAIDPKIGVLQARDATGKPVFTVMSLAAHNQEIGHSGLATALDPAHPESKTPLNQQLSSDWPGYFHRKLEAGGDSGLPMFLVGDNGSEEDPEPVPPVWQNFPECYTIGTDKQGHEVKNQDGCYPQARATGEALAATVSSEAKKADELPFGAVTFDRHPLYVPVENNAFRVAFNAGLFGERPGYSGDQQTGKVGKDLRTWVSVLDVGSGLQLIQNPGEAFPALMLGSPFGQDEVACPNRPNPSVPTWRAHAPYRFQVGLADDMIGYEIPAWSFVEPGVFTTDQCDLNNGDPKGHKHKLESEGVGPTASNAVANELSSIVTAHGADPTAVIRPGRFVLPDGTLTRRPNGAVAAWVADSPAATSLTPGKGVLIGLTGVTGFGSQPVDQNGRAMDYDGIDQAAEGTVVTRGMVQFDCTGAVAKRYYLDVYPVLTAPAKIGAVTKGSIGVGCGAGIPGLGTPGNPLIGPPLVGAGSSSGGGKGHACRDRKRPSSNLARRSVRLRKGRVSIRGRSKDRGCKGKLSAVLVSVARIKGHRCRFLEPNGRLSPARRCRRPILLRARGTTKWRLATRAQLKSGPYRVLVRAVDRSGNRERPSRRNHIVLRVR